MSEVVKGILRAVSSALQVPTIVILILLILLTVLMLGSFIAEIVTERRTLKMNIPKLVDALQGKTTEEMKTVIASSRLLARQKAAAQELISRVTYPEDTREALARQLIADEEARYGKIVKITDLTARVAPMFGLMGTLIPLGPGLIALSKGDAATLSDSILIAFDTTVAGLISGAVSYIVSGVRKGWYEEYMIGLETIMETILDVQNAERKKALAQKKAADAAKAANVPISQKPAAATQPKPVTGKPLAAAPQTMPQEPSVPAPAVQEPMPMEIELPDVETPIPEKILPADAQPQIQQELYADITQAPVKKAAPDPEKFQIRTPLYQEKEEARHKAAPPAQRFSVADELKAQSLEDIIAALEGPEGGRKSTTHRLITK